MTDDSFAAAVTSWYADNARNLPWRAPGVTPWGVLVSEVMLQQTPVSRVLPVWQAWLSRWPVPAALAADSPGEAVRAWGRLGYPRRALRLHAAACAIDRDHDGAVPASYQELLALPGIGDYTAAAVACFGFGQRHGVLDTNVRRVYARYVEGSADALTSSPTSAERRAALTRVPSQAAAAYSVAVMELGAVVCTARAPDCGECPVESGCAWRAAGSPALETVRAGQRYAGTDRQVRGRLLAVLREADDAVDLAALDVVWPDAHQRDRCLASLLADGLVESPRRDRYRLPT